MEHLKRKITNKYIHKKHIFFKQMIKYGVVIGYINTYTKYTLFIF